MMTPQRWLRLSEIEPMPGDFIVERGGGILSSAIAFRQGGRWGHVSIPVSTFAKVEMHWPHGIQCNLLNFSHEWAYLRLKAAHQQKLNVAAWKQRLEEHIERRVKYDTLGIIGSALNLPGVKNRQRRYCSSLLEDLLQRASGMLITRSQFPWPDRCFESEMYNVIGWSATGRAHAEFNPHPEPREEIELMIPK